MLDPCPKQAAGLSLAERLLETAARLADRPAVISPSAVKTYGDVLARAGKWRNVGGRKLDGAPGIIAVAMDDPCEIIPAMLGALSGGATVLPISPAWPVSRIRAILASARPRAMFADAIGRSAVASSGWDGGFASPEESGGAVDIPVSAGGPDHPAFVFYTSGSSGVPKGIFIPERSLIDEAEIHRETLSISPDDRFSALYSPAALGSTRDIFAALLHGAAWCPFPFRDKGPAALAAWLSDARISIYHSVPAIFRSLCGALVRPLQSVRVVFLAGDAVRSADVAAAATHFPEARFYTGLGCTETCSLFVHQFIDPANASDPLPSGYPVRGRLVRILGEDGAPVARDGEPGEIVVSGPTLPSAHPEAPSGDRSRNPSDCSEGAMPAVFTGDWGYWKNGALVFCGRRDEQLKVSGVRLSLPGIDAALAGLRGVREAAASALPGGGIGAAVVLEEGAAFPDPLHDALAGCLPPEAIPSEVTVLRALPRLPSGKLDRVALAGLLAQKREASRPLSTSENEIAAIWNKFLPPGAVVAPGSTFKGLGGDSLGSLGVASEIERLHGIRPRAEWFSPAASLANWAAWMASAEPAPNPSVEAESLTREEIDALHRFVGSWGGFGGRGAPIAGDGLGVSLRKTGIASTPLVWIFGTLETADLFESLSDRRPVILLPSPLPVLEKSMGALHRFVRYFAGHPVFREGDFDLGGFCNNGAAATHLAAGLRGAGFPARGLVLFDTIAHNFQPPVSGRIRHLVTAWKLLRQKRWTALAARFRHKLGGGTLPPWTWEPPVAPPENESVALIWSEESGSPRFGTADRGWGRTGARYSWNRIGGNHMDFLREPFIGEMLDLLANPPFPPPQPR